MRQLQGLTVAITGASRGLGRGLAVGFAREGAALALCARDETVLDGAAAEARRHGVDVLSLAADMGSARDIERFVATTLARFGRVDVLVNNASDLGPVPLPFLSDAPSAGLQRVLDVNVVGVFRLTQALLGGMLMRGSGLVINVTSDAATEGYPGWGLYGASKAALEALTRSWSAETAGSGVRLIAVDPGDMDTAMHRAAVPVAAAILQLVLAGPPPAAGRVSVEL
jgi:NAD(P)-dependent dehydrogenase (short-subunit alcohol dehydrogenase family)